MTEPPPDYPSDAEIQQAYQLNQTKLMQPRRYHLAQIYLPVSRGSADDSADGVAVRTRLEQLIKPLRSSPDRFAEIARSASEDKASADNGGDLGWLSESQLDPAVRDKVAALSKGEISPPVFAAGGWHVLRMIDTQAAAVLPLEQARPELVRALRRQRAEALQADYLRKILVDDHASLDRGAFESLAGPPKAAASAP
jgi:parvulin-like peptidyl-prolyl isomerase